MKDKHIIFFYIVSVFLLANGAFATSIFSQLHLPFWRQLVWILGMIIMYQKVKRLKSITLNKFLNEHIICFLWTVLLSLITLLFYDFNIVRLVYAWWLYFSGLPFVLFPLIWKTCGYSLKAFRYLFIILGAFLSIGLILDYLSGGMFSYK